MGQHLELNMLALKKEMEKIALPQFEDVKVIATTHEHYIGSALSEGNAIIFKIDRNPMDMVNEFYFYVVWYMVVPLANSHEPYQLQWKWAGEIAR